MSVRFFIYHAFPLWPAWPLAASITHALSVCIPSRWIIWVSCRNIKHAFSARGRHMQFFPAGKRGNLSSVAFCFSFFGLRRAEPLPVVATVACPLAAVQTGTIMTDFVISATQRIAAVERNELYRCLLPFPTFRQPVSDMFGQWCLAEVVKCGHFCLSLSWIHL